MSDELFQGYVNAELPKRVATNEDPTQIPEGKVFVTTGVGLITELKPYSTTEGEGEKTIWKIVEWQEIKNGRSTIF